MEILFLNPRYQKGKPETFISKGKRIQKRVSNLRATADP